jgi:phosphohistidine phosphatase
MRLYLMRHGPAGDSESWQGDDRLRPLTGKGQQKVRAAADGLKRLDPGVDALVSSPLVRARQTADIVAKALRLTVEEQEALAPGFGLTELASLLASHRDAQGLMLFGHEPDFSAVIGQLIAAPDAAHVDMKKGACCALDLPDPAAAQLAGSATLLWLMTPRQLALLGE